MRHIIIDKAADSNYLLLLLSFSIASQVILSFLFDGTDAISGKEYVE